jgi:hypothetical protein
VPTHKEMIEPSVAKSGIRFAMVKKHAELGGRRETWVLQA